MLALLVTDVGEHLLRILVIRRLDVGVVLVDSLKLPDDVLANGVDELLVSLRGTSITNGFEIVAMTVPFSQLLKGPCLQRLR